MMGRIRTPVAFPDSVAGVEQAGEMSDPLIHLAISVSVVLEDDIVAILKQSRHMQPEFSQILRFEHCQRWTE